MNMRDFVLWIARRAVRVYNDLTGQRTNTAKLNWLVYIVGSYGIIEHSLSDRVCVAWFEYRIGYLASLVPVGSMHRAYTLYIFTQKIDQ